MKRKWLKASFYLVSGALSGFVNGFFGTGGGIILLFAMYIDARHLGSTTETKDRFAQTAVITLLFSAVSAIFYISSGVLAAGESIVYIVPAAIGGYLGARLLDKIGTVWLNRIFAILIIIAGGIMLLR